MMGIHLQSLRRIFHFFGITTFLLLGIGILQWHKTLRKLSKERVTLPLSHPPAGMLTCYELYEANFNVQYQNHTDVHI